MATIWKDVLSDVPDEALEAAAQEYLRSDAEWRPVPGKLRARALEMMGLDSRNRAMAAWEKHRDWNDKHMLESAREDGDALAEKAIRTMRLHLKNIPYVEGGCNDAAIMAERQKAFVAAYEECARQEQGERLLVGAGANIPTLKAGE